MKRKLILAGSISMMIAVVLGATGAHALKEIIEIEQLKSFETAVRYQVYHSLALILFASFEFLNVKTQKILLYGFVGGIVLFSGSIYALVLAPSIGFNLSFLGPITPVGGLLLISTWFVIIFKTLRYKSANY